MLTIRKVQTQVGDRRGALAAASYALELADSPRAFAEEGDEAVVAPRASSVWVGSRAALAQLGLQRGTAVELEALAAALAGQHAVTGVQVRRPGRAPLRDRDGNKLVGEDGEALTVQAVNSYDLTFSAPKSVSAVWAVADAELRARIEDAMLTAASAALEHLMRTRLVVKDKKGPRLAQGHAASASLHVTARTAKGESVPAPQLHVHMHLVGVLDEDGALRSPDSGALYRQSGMRVGGAVGRAVLAEELRRLGFAVEARTGRGRRYFELAGVPRALCERWSGRSRDVFRWIQEVEARIGGALSGRLAALAAAATRSEKSRVPAADVQAVWRAEAQEHAFDAAAARELTGGAALEAAAGVDLEALERELRTAVVGQLWAEGPTISVGALEAIAFEFATEAGASRAWAAGVVGRMQQEGELVALEGQLATSREIRALERRVAETVAAAGSTRGPAISREAIDHGIAVAEAALGGHELDPEQRAAVELLCSGVGWACLTGRPGTGKGPVLHAAVAAHQFEGWQVIACSADGATAARLAQQIGGSAMSLAQLEWRVEQARQDVEEGRRPRVRIDDRTLILSDEASKTGLRDWDMQARLWAETQARVIPVGDRLQMGAVECPGMFDVMLRETPTARLGVVRRHVDPDDPSKQHPWLVEYHDALYAAASVPEPRREEGERREGERSEETSRRRRLVEEAIGVLREHGAIDMHDTREDAMGEMVARWAADRERLELDVRETVMVVYGLNEDVDHVNRLAQAQRLAAGELGTASVAATDREHRLHEGDVVMLRERAYQPAPERPGGRWAARVENGTMGTIVRIDPERERVTVAFDVPGGGSREVMVELAALRAARAAARADQRPGEPPERIPALRLCYAGHPFPLQGATFRYTRSLWRHGRQRLIDVISGDARAKHWHHVHVDRESIGLDGTESERYERLAEQLTAPPRNQASIELEEQPEAWLAPHVVDLGEPPAFPRLEVALPLRVHDPLRHHRDLLGPERVARIERRADALAQAAAALEDEQLAAAVDAAEESIVRLDPHAARVTRALERDRLLLTARVQEARRAAEELEARAADPRERLNRRERAQLAGEATARRREHAQDERRLALLAERERELHEQDRHLDDWLHDERETLARATAAERELGRRHARVADAADRARGAAEPAPGQAREPAAAHAREAGADAPGMGA